jgi:hypothetical protein
VFWRTTLASLHNANYLICQQTFHIYRLWINFSIGTKGQSFTYGELTYHPYRQTVFWRATLSSLHNAKYLICQQTFRIYRWWIHFSIGTDGQSLFNDGELTYHPYQRTVFRRATLSSLHNAKYLICLVRASTLIRFVLALLPKLVTRAKFRNISMNCVALK